jgi:hypothetical protein
MPISRSVPPLRPRLRYCSRNKNPRILRMCCNVYSCFYSVVYLLDY